LAQKNHLYQQKRNKQGHLYIYEEALEP
jgi:hypothetical protein